MTMKPLLNHHNTRSLTVTHKHKIGSSSSSSSRRLFRSLCTKEQERRGLRELKKPIEEEKDDADVKTLTQTQTTKTTKTEWNKEGLRAETQRQDLRQQKKVANAITKLREAMDKHEELMNERDCSLERLEQCPDVDSLERDLREKKGRLDDIKRLFDLIDRLPKKTKMISLSSSRSGSNIIDDDGERKLFAECVGLAESLSISDSPPEKQARGPKKQKAQASSGPRRPYFAYLSTDGSNCEIRVGRTSEDNDLVSLDPTNSPDEYWMHAAGCPGSHVVIKSTNPSEQTFTDAALLAIKFSKANQRGRAKVSLVKCRQVSKPKGAKAGLVRLSGDVRSIEVRVDESALRLENLERTKT
jgi:predicted ribosome quality control (RQC) complex YloA/Tae2 family protein